MNDQAMTDEMKDKLSWFLESEEVVKALHLKFWENMWGQPVYVARLTPSPAWAVAWEMAP